MSGSLEPRVELGVGTYPPIILEELANRVQCDVGRVPNRISICDEQCASAWRPQK
jgi:hypothetical protein